MEKSNGSTGMLYWYMSPGVVAEFDLSGNLKSEYVFFASTRVACKDFPGRDCLVLLLRPPEDGAKDYRAAGSRKKLST